MREVIKRVKTNLSVELVASTDRHPRAGSPEDDKNVFSASEMIEWVKTNVADELPPTATTQATSLRGIPANEDAWSCVCEFLDLGEVARFAAVCKTLKRVSTTEVGKLRVSTLHTRCIRQLGRVSMDDLAMLSLCICWEAQKRDSFVELVSQIASTRRPAFGSCGTYCHNLRSVDVDIENPEDSHGQSDEDYDDRLRSSIEQFGECLLGCPKLLSLRVRFPRLIDDRLLAAMTALGPVLRENRLREFRLNDGFCPAPFVEAGHEVAGDTFALALLSATNVEELYISFWNKEAVRNLAAHARLSSRSLTTVKCKVISFQFALIPDNRDVIELLSFFGRGDELEKIFVHCGPVEPSLHEERRPTANHAENLDAFLRGKTNLRRIYFSTCNDPGGHIGNAFAGFATAEAERLSRSPSIIEYRVRQKDPKRNFVRKLEACYKESGSRFRVEGNTEYTWGFKLITF